MRQKYNKAEIIEKGVALFRHKGYHNTGVDDILKSCGIPSGSFYNFFKNKEGFALQALEQYHQRYLAMLDQLLLDDSISPLERLRRLFEGNVKMHIAQDCSQGCLLNNLTSEVASLNLKIGQVAAKHYQRNAEKLADVIRSGQHLGEIRTDYKALDLAFYLTDSFAGASVRMQAGKNDQPLKLFMRTAFEFLKPR